MWDVALDHIVQGTPPYKLSTKLSPGPVLDKTHALSATASLLNIPTWTPCHLSLTCVSSLLNYLSVTALVFLYMLNFSYIPHHCDPGLLHHALSAYSSSAIVGIWTIEPSALPPPLIYTTAATSYPEAFVAIAAQIHKNCWLYIVPYVSLYSHSKLGVQSSCLESCVCSWQLCKVHFEFENESW